MHLTARTVPLLQLIYNQKTLFLDIATDETESSSGRVQMIPVGNKTPQQQKHSDNPAEFT